MTDAKPQLELTFFAREVCNRMALLPPAQQHDAFAAVILVTAELTREILGHKPELVDEFIQLSRAQLGGLH